MEKFYNMTEHIETTVLETESVEDETEEEPVEESPESEQENTDKNEAEIEETEIEEELNKPVEEVSDEKEEEIKSGLDALYDSTDDNVEPVKLGSLFDSEQKLEKLFEEQEGQPRR